MSSETSTDRASDDASDRSLRLPPGASVPDQSLQPWQFFVLAALTCATIVTFIVRGQGLMTVILLTVIMGTIALLGLAALHVVRPLVSESRDRTAMIGERTRAGLEREKTLTLRAIKELEFDHAMGKISAEDFREMGGRLRSRAMRLMKQLDAGSGYREQIERDLAKRLGDAKEANARASAGAASTPAVKTRACASCSTLNDLDAKFCKSCGEKL